MLPNLTLSSVVAALVLALPGQAAPQQMAKRSSPELSVAAQLRLADTAAERYKILSKDEDFVFDFSKSEFPVASRSNFPALVGSGGSFSITSMDACTTSFLHLHPRATEMFAVNSGRVVSEMVPETGVIDSANNQRVIRTDLGPGMMTIFPAGSFHVTVNPDCEPANITAAFTSEDIGIGLVTEQTFALSDDVIATQFGHSIAGEDIDTVRDALPGTMIIKVEECLSKCGKQKRTA